MGWESLSFSSSAADFGKSSVEKPGTDLCNLLSRMRQKVAKPPVYKAFMISDSARKTAMGPATERGTLAGGSAVNGAVRLLPSAATRWRYTTRNPPPACAVTTASTPAASPTHRSSSNSSSSASFNRSVGAAPAMNPPSICRA